MAKVKYFILVMAVLGLVLTAGCATGPAPGENITMEISSVSFRDSDKIPVKYTCDGQNISPPLAWKGVSRDTRELALIVDDPDARGTFTHWVLFKIPPSVNNLPEAVPAQEQLPSGALHGKNGAGRSSYTGPCPPPGPVHHYNFTLYALDKALDLAAGSSKQQVLDAMQGHVLATAKLIGIYQR